ncbi:helix-turn-helix transcriptional regulator [Sphingorhabdus sp.]|uniref:helix-turn-helix transcriptional regulator n=1 Tax=Sphingorhabdus sp. TaxID=1902408 RepID=UPI003919DAA0
MVGLMSKKSFVDSNISMIAQSSPELTEGQKACLRLVVQHHTSKEIARKLGISRYTVDQRLDAARRKLRASSRKEAAIIFAAHEMQPISEQLVYEAFALDAARLDTNESSTFHWVKKRSVTSLPFASSLPNGGRETYELSGKEFLLHALNVTFFSTLVLALVVVVLTGVFQLVQ